MSIGSISGVQSALLGLSKTSKDLQKVASELATSKKFSFESKDPINIQQLSRLASEVRGYEVTSASIDAVAGMVGTAESGLTSALSSLSQLRDIAVQAADGTLSGQERQNLMSQARSLTQSLDSISSNYDFGGVNLLDGTFINKNLQIGPNQGDVLSISIPSTSTASLGVNTIDMSSAASAGNAITAIDNAISQVTSNMSDVGSVHNRLEEIKNANEKTSLSLQNSLSQVGDVDYARAMMQMMQVTFQYQAHTRVLSEAMKAQEISMSFFV